MAEVFREGNVEKISALSRQHSAVKSSGEAG
jgi:hypothetical protein